jgi:hypothetical protein
MDRLDYACTTSPGDVHWDIREIGERMRENHELEHTKS